MKQEVRIIGGVYRGKKLHFPQIEHLRPTPDRVRETVFNWLMHDIKNANCLDAFAGSGALGFESFSRGAKAVTFLEKNAEAFKILNKTLRSFPTVSLKAYQIDTLVFLQQTDQQFDIIFLDPPFNQDLITPSLDLIYQRNLLKPEGLIYIESKEVCELNPEYWTQKKAKQAGLVHYSLFTKMT